MLCGPCCKFAVNVKSFIKNAYTFDQPFNVIDKVVYKISCWFMLCLYEKQKPENRQVSRFDKSQYTYIFNSNSKIKMIICLFAKKLFTTIVICVLLQLFLNRSGYPQDGGTLLWEGHPSSPKIIWDVGMACFNWGHHPV